MDGSLDHQQTLSKFLPHHHLVINPSPDHQPTSPKFLPHHHLVMQRSLSLTPGSVKTPPKLPQLNGWGRFPTLKFPGPEGIGARFQAAAIAPIPGQQNRQSLHLRCGDRPQRQQQSKLSRHQRWGLETVLILDSLNSRRPPEDLLPKDLLVADDKIVMAQPRTRRMGKAKRAHRLSSAGNGGVIRRGNGLLKRGVPSSFFFFVLPSPTPFPSTASGVGWAKGLSPCPSGQLMILS